MKKFRLLLAAGTAGIGFGIALPLIEGSSPTMECQWHSNSTAIAIQEHTKNTG